MIKLFSLVHVPLSSPIAVHFCRTDTGLPCPIGLIFKIQRSLRVAASNNVSVKSCHILSGTKTQKKRRRISEKKE